MSQFKRNILHLMGGSAASQVIVIGATPFLTRLYEPEAFGALAIFSAAYAIVVGVLTLKYDLSIILPESDNKAYELTVLTLIISVIGATLLLLALAGVHALTLAPLQDYFFLLPICALVGASYTCAQQWGARASDYRRFSRSQVVNAVANVGLVLILAVFMDDYVGTLIIGYTVGFCTALVYISHPLLRKMPRREPISLVRLFKSAWEYRRFPQFVLPSTLITSLGANGTPFVLQVFFPLQQVGYYAIAQRFLMTPAALVGGAVVEAFRAEFVQRHRNRASTSAFFRSTLVKLFSVGVPVFGFIYWVAPPIFELLLGPNYREAGFLARYICVGAFSQFISQPFHFVFIATGHVRLGFAITFAMTVLPLFGIVLGGMRGGMGEALLLSASITFFLSLTMIALAYKACHAADDRSFDGGGYV